MLINPAVVGTLVFACAFAGALVGMWLRAILSKHFLDAESRDTIKVGIGLIATMTALLLSLVTASAKSAFDAVSTAAQQTAIEISLSTACLLAMGPRPTRFAKT